MFFSGYAIVMQFERSICLIAEYISCTLAAHGRTASPLVFFSQIISSILFSSGQLNMKLAVVDIVRKDNVQEGRGVRGQLLRLKISFL